MSEHLPNPRIVSFRLASIMPRSTYTFDFISFYGNRADDLVGSNGTVIAQHGDHIFETQFARCMSNRYRTEDFPRCVSCTRRWAGDTCRFQGIRCFVKDASLDNVIVGMRFNSAKPSDVPELHFPKIWNVPLNQRHIDRCKVSSSPLLEPFPSMWLCFPFSA